jgi:hypothetical protein
MSLNIEVALLGGRGSVIPSPPCEPPSASTIPSGNLSAGLGTDTVGRSDAAQLRGLFRPTALEWGIDRPCMVLLQAVCPQTTGPPLHYAEVSKQRVALAFDQIKYDPTFKGINSLIF